MTAVATATMRGQALDIRTIPGWQTAPRIWRTVGPEMRVRIVSPAWIQRQSMAIAERQQKEQIDGEIRQRQRDEWMQLVSAVADKRGIVAGSMFMTGRLPDEIYAVRFECFALLRRGGVRVIDIANFFGVVHSCVAKGIRLHLKRNREVME